MSDKHFFCVDARKYLDTADFQLYRPASINSPKSNSVMFITEEMISLSHVFDTIDECLIFWPLGLEIPEQLKSKHVVITCKNPHLEYSRFFSDNQIIYLPKPEKVTEINGALIADTAVIGKNTVIFPYAYIGGEVVIGDNCYIGSGVKIVSGANIGNNVIIRENTVIGADSLTTDRDEYGQPITMPQFGGVQIEDDVQIGANSIIARGAIDNTHIKKGSKISNLVVISHNVCIGEYTFIAAGTVMLGSSSAGDKTLISINCIVNNRAKIGNNCILGMGSIALNSIPEGKVAYGSPAMVARDLEHNWRIK